MRIQAQRVDLDKYNLHDTPKAPIMNPVDWNREYGDLALDAMVRGIRALPVGQRTAMDEAFMAAHRAWCARRTGGVGIVHVHFCMLRMTDGTAWAKEEETGRGGYTKWYRVSKASRSADELVRAWLHRRMGDFGHHSPVYGRR